MSAELKFEHFAINVADPVAVARWYRENLGMKIVRQGNAPAHVHFLADATDQVVLEIYNNPPERVPDYPNQHPQVLHIAFAAADIEGERQRLIDAGATPCGEVGTTAAGDRLAMLRDPWGFAVQLTQRAEPMV